MAREEDFHSIAPRRALSTIVPTKKTSVRSCRAHGSVIHCHHTRTKGRLVALCPPRDDLCLRCVYFGHAFGQIAHHGGKATKILPIHEVHNVVAIGVRPGPIFCKGDIANPHAEELGRQSLGTLRHDNKLGAWPTPVEERGWRSDRGLS